MHRHTYLNAALIVVGVLIVVLGVTLVLTVPPEVKDFVRARHERILSGDPDRGFAPGDETFPAFPHRWGRYGYHRGPFFFGAGRLLGFAFIVLLVVAAGFVVVRGTLGSRRFSGEREAVEILREKYASGEISKDEYTARRRVLEAKE